MKPDDAITYDSMPVFYCRERGCEWTLISEWNPAIMAEAKRAGIDHWKATHGPDTKREDGEHG